MKIVLKKFLWAYNIKMAQNYKIKDFLKNLPFYSSESKKSQKRIKLLQMLDFYLNYHFFSKKIKI